MSEKWLNGLRRKLEDHTEDVPEKLWDDIRSELFDEDRHLLGAAPSDLKGQTKKSTFTDFAYRAVGVAAILAFIFFGINQFFQIYKEKKIVQKNITSEDSKTVMNDSRICSEEIEKNRNSLSQNEKFKNNSTSIMLDDQSIGKISSKTIKEFLKENVNIVLNAQQQYKNSGLIPQAQIFPQENSIKTNDDDLQENNELLAKNEFEKKTDLPKNKSNKSWMVSVLTGNASQGSADQFPGYATFNGSSMSADNLFYSSGGDLEPFIQVLLANQNQEVVAKIKHNMPITFGASAYYNIGKRWGIGTGITYTKLSSELHSGSNSNYIQSNQTIHYVGVPVQVNYNVFKKAGFTGYLTGGTLIEKSVSGNLKTKYVVENSVKNETEEKINAKPTQISVNAAAGVQLNITNRLGIYAEPGLGYHFKDNSSLNTIYKEKPLNFNLRFGLRLSLE